jgi:hypothetical protein
MKRKRGRPKADCYRKIELARVVLRDRDKFEPGTVRQRLHQMRKACEQDGMGFVYLTKDEFWSDRPMLLERSGFKVRVAGPGDPVAHDAEYFGFTKRQARAVDLKIAAMDGGAKAAKELRKRWREEDLAEKIARIDEVMRERKLRRTRSKRNKNNASALKT